MTIKLTDFEGPLDLLLHLIKKNKMNIFDLPIAQITQQYLDFIRVQKSMELDVASEYLVMAANLIRLKSIDLLPRPAAVDELEDDYQDPRQELIDRLLAYHRYQAASEFFQERVTQEQHAFTRPTQLTDANQQKEIHLTPGLTLIDLQLAFDSILNRQQAKIPQRRQIQKETYTIGEGIDTLRQRLAQAKPNQSLNLDQLLADIYERDFLLVLFLALLELAKSGEIALSQSNRQAEILIKVIINEQS
ncbi:segregation and condensation protein A [Convivina praedatoris]|uniref:segregation and condensation protein A n=1 Tax=Convivina praedatoris TaxID=2880963 RepID=UPI00200FCD5A|nr:segregation/condensation protein A [Convivina sp. LMG 32447]